MSDGPHMRGWWQASDGNWYPPEQHPDYAAPPPPPGAQPRGPAPKQKSGTSATKVALGVVLGLFLFVVACSALVAAGAHKVTSDANKPGTVAINAPASACWTATLTGGTNGVSQSQHDGCGPGSYPMPTGVGANAIVSLKDAGPLTVTLTIAGRQTAVERTDSNGGSVTVSR